MKPQSPTCRTFRPERLRAELYRLGYTQAAFAAAIGVHTRAVEHWLSGRIRPAWCNVERMEQAGCREVAG